jgi:hypothetical protein
VGLGKAKVSLSFADWKEGAVVSTTVELPLSGREDEE